MDTFDLIIIGSGSGNAIPPHLAGWKIALVERGIFGGTCLNVGCIPSKMFVLPADLAETARHGDRIGVASRVDGVDFAAIRDRVFGRIDPIAAGGKQYRATGTPGVELITGTARFTGDRTFDVDGRAITAPIVLLAAGARPVIPDIPGLADVAYHTSDTVMRLDRLPARLGVIGGGYIAVELGHVFAAYGSAVTMWTRSPRFLSFEDEEIATRFTEVFAPRVDHRAGLLPDRIETTARRDRPPHRRATSPWSTSCWWPPGGGPTPTCSTWPPAASPPPTTAGWWSTTPWPPRSTGCGPWATSPTPTSSSTWPTPRPRWRSGTWPTPTIGTGSTTGPCPTPSSATPRWPGSGSPSRRPGPPAVDFVVGRRDYGGTAYGWALEDSESFAKVLINRADRRILGAHVIGPQAATLVQPLIQAMQFDQPADRVAHEVFYIHPALTEVVENALLDGLEQLDSRPPSADRRRSSTSPSLNRPPKAADDPTMRRRRPGAGAARCRPRLTGSPTSCA